MARAATLRRLTISDGLVLVAAVAFGLWLSRLTLQLHGDLGLAKLRSRVWVIYLSASFPVLLATSQAVLLLRLRRPRPLGLRLRRQPGLVASAAAAFMTIYKTLYLFLPGLIYLPQANPTEINLWLYLFLVDISNPEHIASGVGLAWSVQALLGAWRPEPSWVDRLGRTIGWAWIGLFAVRFLTHYFARW